LCAKRVFAVESKRVVLEVTRKIRIREHTRFREAAACFRARGYNLAVDDARAGTLSLRTVLELELDRAFSPVCLGSVSPSPYKVARRKSPREPWTAPNNASPEMEK
jgi:hypothetical protein